MEIAISVQLVWAVFAASAVGSGTTPAPHILTEAGATLTTEDGKELKV